MVTVWTTRIRCKLQTSGFFPNYYTILYPYSQMLYPYSQMLYPYSQMLYPYSQMLYPYSQMLYPYSQMFYVKHLYVVYFICYYYMFRSNRWRIIPM